MKRESHTENQREERTSEKEGQRVREGENRKRKIEGEREGCRETENNSLIDRKKDE